MTGADFILLINMTVSGLFAFAFLAVAIYARDNAAAPVFALGFVFAMLYFLTELAIPSISNPRLGYMLAFTTYYLALSSLVVGLARMYLRPVPWIALAALTVVSLVVVYGIYDIARSKMIGMVLYQAPYFLVLLLGVRVILRVDRSSIDTLMAILFGISAVHFLFKPVIAVLSGGVGAEPGGTAYAMFSQSIGAGLSVAGGLLLLLSLMRELIANMMIHSETDQLSGLLNRRGLEFRAEAAIKKSKRMRQALSLVLCDIDHFKAINDTHGHALGDRVIAAFSAELRKQAIGKRGIAARIGGEEFAVILPGNTVQSAWRFADKTRLLCRDIRVPGKNGVITFTASFGVSEMESDDMFSDLYRRADGALYEAKKSGRNNVRTALPILMDDNIQDLQPATGR